MLAGAGRVGKAMRLPGRRNMNQTTSEQVPLKILGKISVLSPIVTVAKLDLILSETRLLVNPDFYPVHLHEKLGRIPIAVTLESDAFKRDRLELEYRVSNEGMKSLRRLSEYDSDMVEFFRRSEKNRWTKSDESWKSVEEGMFTFLDLRAAQDLFQTLQDHGKRVAPEKDTDLIRKLREERVAESIDEFEELIGRHLAEGVDDAIDELQNMIESWSDGYLFINDLLCSADERRVGLGLVLVQDHMRGSLQSQLVKVYRDPRLPGYIRQWSWDRVYPELQRQLLTTGFHALKTTGTGVLVANNSL
jgi:hypothetical protein